MAAEYDFQRKPNPKGDGELQPMYPRIVNKGTITGKRSGHSSCHWRRKSSCVVGPAGTGRAESARRTGSPEPKSP